MPWSYLAMGDYPYPSSYLMHGDSMLPAWPVRAACTPLDQTLSTPAALMRAVRDAVAVYYNSTGTERCYYNGPNTPSAYPRPSTMRDVLAQRHATPAQKTRRSGGSCTGDWGWQWCTEMVQPFSSGTGKVRHCG